MQQNVIVILLVQVCSERLDRHTVYDLAETAAAIV